MNYKLHNEIVKLETEKSLFKRIIDYIVLCARIFYDVFIKNKNSRNIAISVDDLYANIRDLEEQTRTLSNQIIEYQTDICDKDNKIKELEAKIRIIEKDLCIENRYMDILVLLQHLDTWVDALPEEVSNFKTITKGQISQVLANYGYKFLDFSFEDIKSYDYEIYPNEPQEIVYRAIINEHGTVAKGIIYLPKI